MRLFNLSILYFGLTLLLLIILPLSVFAQYGGNADLPKAPALSVSLNVCVNGSPNITLAWSGVNQTDSFNIYRYEYTPPAGGDGLTGSYYDNDDFTEFRLNRIDPTINFTWGGGSPDSEIRNDHYSILWSGLIVPKYSERYTFYLTSDDGASLFINNQTVIDNWAARGLSNKSGFLDLTTSQMYSISITYKEISSDAQVHLEWKSNSQTRQIVPKSALYSTSITGTQIATNLSQSARSYTDTTALPNKLYSYRVVAVNTYGSASSSWTPYQLTQACSQPIIDNNSIITSCTSPPSSPAISFNFADSSPNRAFYNVYRQTLSGASSGQIFKIASNQAASQKSFTDNPTTNPSYPLAANTAYRYQVGGVDNLLVETFSAWSNSVTTTGCDGAPPDVFFNFVSLNACYTPATWQKSPPQPIQATATDSPAGVATVHFRVTRVTNPSDLPLPNTADILADNTPPSNIYSKSLIYPTVDFSTIGGVGFSYKIEVRATDNAGNISPWKSSQPFDYHASCGTPWIQTQGGDVHSNNGINAPGGP